MSLKTEPVCAALALGEFELVAMETAGAFNA